MKGKQKCAILKQIRRDIVKKNDIAVTIADCKHRGDCKGTCPRCEAEVRAIEEALRQRRAKGFRTVVAGVSAGVLAANLAACDPIEAIRNLRHSETLQGDLAPVTDRSTESVDGLIETLQGDIPGEIPDPGEISDDVIEKTGLLDSEETEPETTDEVLMGEPTIDPEENVIVGMMEGEEDA